MKLIDAARLVLKRKGLRNYFDYSDFVSPVRIESSTPDKVRLTFNVSFGRDGLVLAKPVRGVAEHEHLQQLLNDSITLPVRFMLDAERELYYNNHLFALLNAVIALEIVVSDTIRIIANCKGVSPSEINKFIQDVGLTGNIKATLRLLAPQEVVLPDDSIFAQCKSAITLRNNIMHQGQREVPENSVPGYLQNIETMFGFCEHLKTQYSKTQT